MGIDTGKYEAYTTIKYYLNLYDFEKAENLMNHYLEKYPEDPFILAEKAFVLNSIKNKPGEALTVLKKSLAAYPGYYYSNYLYASVLYLFHTTGKSVETGDNLSMLDAVVKYLKVSIKDNDKFYDSLFLMGIILSSKEKYEASNRYLEKAIQLKRTAEPYFYMAFNYRQLKDHENELNSYEEVLGINPYNSRALNALSQYYLNHGDIKKAVIYLEKLFLKFPGDKKVSFDYLYSLFAANETEKFLEVSETVDISGFPLLRFARAFFLGQKERLTEAIELLNDLKNRDLKANLLLADLYKRKRDYYKAYQVLEKIKESEKNYLYYSLHMEVLSLFSMHQRILKEFEQIKKDNTIMEKFLLRDYHSVIFANVHLNPMESLLELTRFIKTKLKEESELLDDLIQALEYVLKKGEIEAGNIKFDLNRYLIVYLYKNQKKGDKALSMLKEMIAIGKGESPDPYLELCDVYIEQNESAKAESLIKKTEKMFPSSVEVKNFYAYFLALENRELEKALELSGYTLSRDGENPAYLDTYGYILLKMGRTDEAKTFLEKAYQKIPFEQEIMDHLVGWYRLKKNPREIIKIYQRAINNGVDFKDHLIEKINELKKSNEKQQKKTK
jgi:tetratricopeptide (TPR) repeat protein